MSFFSFLWACSKSSLPMMAKDFLPPPIFAAILVSGLGGLGGQGAAGTEGIASTEKGWATDEDRTFGNSIEMWMQAQAILEPVCMKYLQTFCTENEREKWNAKMTRRIAQSLEESAEASEESWLHCLPFRYFLPEMGRK